MHVLLTGASGMVGQAALLACVADPRVTQITALVRAPLATARAFHTAGKLREVICPDFLRIADDPSVADAIGKPDACLFCAGVSSVGMREPEYRHLTYDMTLAVASFVHERAPATRILYVSGAGTDSSEKGRTMWARVKGATENRLLAMGFASAVLFRPGYIQPLDGVRSKVGWYRYLYGAMRPLYPLLRRLWPNAFTDSRLLGRAMIAAVQPGMPSGIMESREINRRGSI